MTSPSVTGSGVRVSQGTLKAFQRCPLQWRYSHIDKLPREQSGALTFGSILHACVEWMEVNNDLQGAIARFHEQWMDPEAVDPRLKVDYWNRGSTWVKYDREGERILRAWWGLHKWDADVVLAREYKFEVPVGDNTFVGVIDKLVIRTQPNGRPALVVVDFKTNREPPAYEWLQDDVQFTAYCFATTQPEFWVNLPAGMGVAVAGYPRLGEWVHLRGPKRLAAGPRDDVQYRRLRIAIDQIAQSIAMRIFVPNLSGESCRWCEYRKVCGLPPVE